MNPSNGNVFTNLRRVHHKVLSRVNGFQRRLCAEDNTLSYAKTLEKTRRQSIKTDIRERRLFVAANHGVVTQTGDVPEDGWRAEPHT